MSNFRVEQRCDAVVGKYIGKYHEISKGLHHLRDFAINNGYQIKLPFCIVYTKGKTAKFSKTPPTFDMYFYIPVRKE